jgi:hypothetical protein
MFDGDTGHLVVWVRIPFLSSTTFTEFYMYYGNSSASSQQNPVAVWDSSYRMVLHLYEKTGIHYDSTANGNNGTPNGGLAQGITGKIDGADSFDGVNDFVEVPHSGTISGFTTALTASFWVRFDDSNRRQTLLNKYNTAGNQRGWYIEYRNLAPLGKTLGFFASQNGINYKEWYTSFSPTLGVYYYITLVWEANALPRFYVNGQQSPTIYTGTISYMYNSTLAPLHIGKSTYATDRYLRGTLDEIRLSNPARSPGWILTCYNDEKDPSAFYAVGAEEALPSEPIVSDPNPINGATNVPTALTELSFDLTDYQELMDYSVSTYPDVGSNSQTGVGSARYSVAISGLQYSTTYTWKLNVTDGTHWTNKTYTFTTAPAPADWWNTSWQYRRTITIDHTKVSSDQTDFPVLIDLTDNGLRTKVQANGNDFVFTDANQTKLSHEKESYNSGTGHLIVWIKVPVLSSTTDTVLYMYCGNPTCGDQQTRNAVWDSSNRMILHLAETSGTQYDSTVNGNNVTPNNGVIQGTAGKSDGSDTFDGTNDYLQTPHSDTLTVFSQGFTASFWLRLDDVSRRQTILNKYNSATGQRSWYIEYQTNLLGFFASQDGTIYREWHATFRPVAGTWYFIAIAWEPNAVPKFYVNGTQVTTSGAAKIASIYNNAGVPLYIGMCPYDGTRYLRGGLDEIRISNPSRNVGWILSSYNNQKDPTTFYQLGTEEERAPNVAPFSLVVLPDTQVYSQSYPFILDNQTRWIVDNDVNMNMLFVLHEGDIVNSDVVAQWANANSSMSRLDGHVPWAVLPGNHDGTNVGTPSENLANYNTYFPYSRFGGETWYGDAYNSINTNSYVLFSGGEDEYIVFNFQYHPSDAVLAWASTTIATYPNRRAIVVTHDYLNNTDGTRTTEGNHIWNNFVSIHADQIFLVLCGHMHGEARRQDTVNGHVVYQVLADYQTRDNGGNGWLRILEFHPAEDTIHVKTFSPYLNIWETDADSQFILNYEMVDYDDIIFDSSFETGNLKNVQFQSGDALGNRLYTGEQDHTTVSGMTDKHWWFYFSMDDVADKTVTIRLVNNEVADMSTRWAGMEPVYSFDNINWERLPLSAFAVDIPACTFQMTVTLPSEQNKIWLAPLPPYTIGLRDVLFEEFKSSPYLDVTSLGTTPGGQELKVATITDDAYSDSNKIKAYVIAMQHSTEVPGGWEADGMIRFLLSDDPTAQAVRRSYIFRIVPIVNVDGVFYGRSRYTPLREGEQYDLNRWWDDPVANMPFEIAQIFTDIQSFLPQSFNDIHSTIGIEMGSPEDAVTYTWSGGTGDATVVAFLNKIRDAGWPDTQRGTTYYACNQVHSRLGVVRSISWENPQDEFITSPGHKLTISDWREMGKAYAKGVYLDGGGVSYFVPLEFAENAERWKDVADQEYGSSFQETYDYSQATVSIQYSVLDETLTGTLTAQNLKPNFAYQLKLAGTPGTIDNEFLGFAGRWWQEEWNGTAWVNGQNLNNKGSGTSPNPNDNDYFARKSITDGSSQTGYHYRYTGYLLFGYFITDSNGDGNLYFETGNCYHVLWKTTQRAHVADDGPLKTVTFDPVLSAAYDTDYPSSTVSIFGEWERLPMGSVNLAAGNYSCQIVLTEESFHGTGPLEGNWAAAMNTNIFFSIIS